MEELQADIVTLTNQLAIEEEELRIAKQARRDETIVYDLLNSEPSDELKALLEGFDSFYGQFPEALNEPIPVDHNDVAWIFYFFSILLIVVHLKF